MAFKLIATHKPTAQTVEYGPWPYDEDEMLRISRVAFAHGFISGVFSIQYEAQPGDTDFHVVEVPDADASTVPQANTVGEIQAFASASVTHADGSVS